jgi:hypothetical protein
MPIHIRGEDEETLARLKELGLDAHIITDDPLADALFYLSRMNSKLDNLGQIRHLHKIMQASLKMRAAAEAQQAYYARLQYNIDKRDGRFRRLYERLMDLTDVPENDPWRKDIPAFANLYVESDGDLYRVFGLWADDKQYLYSVAENTVYIKNPFGNGSDVLGTEKGGTSVRFNGI